MNLLEHFRSDLLARQPANITEVFEILDRHITHANRGLLTPLTKGEAATIIAIEEVQEEALAVLRKVMLL